jgi:hypothetical protein
MLGAALRQAAPPEASAGRGRDYLLLYGSGLSDEMRRMMFALAPRVWRWQEVIWADALLDPPGGATASPRSRPRGAPIRDALPVEHVDQVWACKLWEAPEKRLFEAFAEAEIVLYEDGLHFYVPQQVRPERPPSALSDPIGRLRRLRARWRRGATAPADEQFIAVEHLARVQRLYLSIAEEVPPPAALAGEKVVLIDRGCLREAMEAAAEGVELGAGDGPADPRAPTALVLGQCFARWKVMEHATELGVYARAVGRLLEQGFTVLWKEHPRADEGFFDAMHAALPSPALRRMQLPPACPIELVFERLGADCLVSGTSSSLFYVPKLFGTAAYTFTRWLDPHVRDANTCISELVAQRIPPLPGEGALAPPRPAA